MKFPALASALFLALVPSWSHAEAPESALLGCWRAVNIVQHYKSGSKAEDASGRCTLHFKLGQFRTSLIGTTREYQYSIAGDRLKTAIEFQPAEPVAPSVTVRVETEAVRMACP
ncbi:MAG: hypothetical protein K0S57_2659 [Ramlibacter sp.]|nr:hypothetical protein [Ramlibacter sp.]